MRKTKETAQCDTRNKTHVKHNWEHWVRGDGRTWTSPQANFAKPALTLPDASDTNLLYPCYKLHYPQTKPTCACRAVDLCPLDKNITVKIRFQNFITFHLKICVRKKKMNDRGKWRAHVKEICSKRQKYVCTENMLNNVISEEIRFWHTKTCVQ